MEYYMSIEDMRFMYALLNPGAAAFMSRRVQPSIGHLKLARGALALSLGAQDYPTGFL